jgi:hypothetical protein
MFFLVEWFVGVHEDGEEVVSVDGDALESLAS